MLSIVPKEHPPRASLHEKRDQRCVRLGRVAVPARQDQIVRTVVGRLAPPGTNVVERDEIRGSLAATIGAYRPVGGKKPFAVRLDGATGGSAKTGNRDCGMSA
jgi:hypothetical protein